MNRNTFNLVFIEDEKETLKEYLRTLSEKIENNDFSGVRTYAEFIQESAIKLNAYENVKRIVFAGQE